MRMLVVMLAGLGLTAAALLSERTGDYLAEPSR